MVSKFVKIAASIICATIAIIIIFIIVIAVVTTDDIQDIGNIPILMGLHRLAYGHN